MIVSCALLGVMLTNSQASAYLPAGKTIICHAGPHHSPTRIELPLFACSRLGQLRVTLVLLS